MQSELLVHLLDPGSQANECRFDVFHIDICDGCPFAMMGHVEDASRSCPIDQPRVIDETPQYGIGVQLAAATIYQRAQSIKQREEGKRLRRCRMAGSAKSSNRSPRRASIKNAQVRCIILCRDR